MVIPPAPNDINNCGVFRILHQKSTEHDGAAVKAQQFITVASPMVDLIATGPFKEYTLHNRDHAKKLLHLIDNLVPANTLARLSVLECLVIVYAVFLHDMGMTVTSTERNRILASADFQDSIREWLEIRNSLTQARKRLATISDDEKPIVENLVFQLNEAALCAYLRPRHATAIRYKSLFSQLKQASGLSDLFNFHGVSFEDWLLDVCVSHNLDAAVLSESSGAYEDRYPRDLTIAQETLNTQFCAVLLRLADILDFDRERTPRILFESLGIPSSEIPGAEVSLKEWEKHMAIHSLELRPDELVISAECHHPAIEKSIRDFCIAIEREIRDTMAILKRNPQSVLEKYTMELPLTVRPRIKSVGYTYKDLSIRLNQSAIISMLMGERLYTHPGVALRELIQNSLDACEVRRRLQLSVNYSPAIEVNTSADALGRNWIEVTDNGIGMDEHVLSDYFLRLGDTYYNSAEFQRHFDKLRTGIEPFCPISRFGIGILSVFLIADVLEVHTSSAFSPREDHSGRLVRIEKLGGLAFVTERERISPGTTVRIRLRPEIMSQYDLFAKDSSKYLKWLLLRPWFFVRVALGPSQLTFNVPNPSGITYTVSQEGRKILREQGYELIVVQLERWSDKLSGIVVLLLFNEKDGKLTNSRDGRRVIFRENNPFSVDPHVVIPNYGGNRLTVNGFQVGTFKTKNLLRFLHGLRFSFLIDVDAIGGDDIEFDVSRERLTGKGDSFLRTEIQTAVLRALSETGEMERMTSEIRLSIPPIPGNLEELRERISNRSERPDALKDLFDSVMREIPNGPWPKALNVKIAEKLGISSKLVSKTISKLLEIGIISNPKMP